LWNGEEREFVAPVPGDMRELAARKFGSFE
jgi:hypothetical protein